LLLLCFASFRNDVIFIPVVAVAIIFAVALLHYCLLLMFCYVAFFLCHCCSECYCHSKCCCCSAAAAAWKLTEVFFVLAKQKIGMQVPVHFHFS